ncbi:MAG: hypothetical protein CMG07_04135 [Candidatus Marinimicrobia bacterium]|nr:hypothetical protein [Candidatus Neomarinimicrobiota bacterium]
MNHKILIIFMLFFYNCDIPLNSSDSQIIYIESFRTNYSLESDSIYIELKIINYNKVTSITSLFSDDGGLIDTLNINDLGLDGDIIPNDGLYSIKFSLNNFQYGKNYYLENIISGNDQLLIENRIINFEENFIPEIIKIEYPSIFYLGISNWDTLDINITIMDRNGIEDIDHALYLINSDFLTKDYSYTEECDHYVLSPEEYLGYQTDPSWILQPDSVLNDSTIVYKTSIPTRPSNDCGGYGPVLFKFIIQDKVGESIQNNDEIVVEILSCGDSTCSEESPYYECSQCPDDCIENINCLEESDCSNNIDEDGDGNIDCDDPDCIGDIFCE